jgi:hypothetical protein
MSLLQLLQAVPAAFVFACLILGLMVGSFSSNITRKRVSLH